MLCRATPHQPCGPMETLTENSVLKQQFLGEVIVGQGVDFVTEVVNVTSRSIRIIISVWLQIVKGCPVPDHVEKQAEVSSAKWFTAELGSRC